MREENNVISSKYKILDKRKEEYPYKQSANTLFRFMSEFEYLKESLQEMVFFSRYVKEDVSFLGLEYDGKDLKEIAFPMLCFCDVSLSRISHHCKFYGYYGIGFAKSTFEERPINCIRYQNVRDYSKTVHIGKNPFTEAFNQFFGKSNNSSSEDSELYKLRDFLWEELTLIKPIKGIMNNNKKNFHDEKEWRFVPKTSGGFHLQNGEKIPYLMNNVEHSELLESTLNEYSNELKKDDRRNDPNLHLKIEINEIKYIIVKSKKEMLELISFIRNLKLSDDDKYLLIASIVVYNQLIEDI